MSITCERDYSSLSLRSRALFSVFQVFFSCQTPFTQQAIKLLFKIYNPIFLSALCQDFTREYGLINPEKEYSEPSNLRSCDRVLSLSLSRVYQRNVMP